MTGRNATLALPGAENAADRSSWFEQKLATDHEARYHLTRWYSRPFYRMEPDWDDFDSADFTEEPYLQAFPDLAATFSADIFLTARDHWCHRGWQEELAGTRPRLPGYSEVRHLSANPDIAAKVADGQLPCTPTVRAAL